MRALFQQYRPIADIGHSPPGPRLLYFADYTRSGPHGSICDGAISSPFSAERQFGRLQRMRSSPSVCGGLLQNAALLDRPLASNKDGAPIVRLFLPDPRLQWFDKLPDHEKAPTREVSQTYRLPYQRPRPYKPPPPSSRIRTTMMRIVVPSMCSSYCGRGVRAA